MVQLFASNPYNLVFYVALAWITCLTSVFRAIPPIIQYFLSCISLIYIGSYLSLKFFYFLTKPGASKEEVERPLSSDEAWKTPLNATIVLVGLYLVLKYLGKEYVNYPLTVYFAFLGIAALKAWIDSLLNSFNSLDKYKEIKLLDIKKLDFQLNLYDIPIYIISLIIVGIYVVNHDWLTNNIIGSAFVLFGFENMYIGRIYTAYIMLGLFFVYDIFFVFGTVIMISLATKIEGPIKLVFPTVNSPKNNILGLGDILLPGLLITICLRYDLFTYLRKTMDQTKKPLKEVFPKTSSDFPKPYFTTCFIGYVIGLGITIIIGKIFRAGQPALLYLVPCTVFPISILALIKGELIKFTQFDEEKEQTDLYEMVKK